MKSFRKWWRGLFVPPILQELGEPDPKLSRDPEQDEMGLEELFQEYANSPDVPKRMLRMANKFGLSKQQIAHPNVQARMVIKKCGTCMMSDRCFRNRDGEYGDKPGFGEFRCANIETYRDIAKAGENRTPIKSDFLSRFWWKS